MILDVPTVLNTNTHALQSSGQKQVSAWAVSFWTSQWFSNAFTDVYKNFVTRKTPCGGTQSLAGFKLDDYRTQVTCKL